MLILKGNTFLSTDCLSFNWGDTTGLYSAANPGGFNSPNPTIAQVTGATLTLVNPSGESVIFGDGENFYPLMPNTNGTLYNIPNTAWGLDSTTAISDMITYATYVVSVGATDYTYAGYVAILCQAECCVKNLLASVNWSLKCEPCDNQNLQAWIKASGMLKSIYADLACVPALPNKAAATLTILTQFCNASGSGCGCQ